MKKLALLLLCLSTTLAITQELSIATLTVGDFQKMYENDGEKALTQKVFQGFSNGYGLGFTAGVAVALLQADVVSRDVTPDFADCMPNTQRLFYEMLSVTDERANLNMAQYLVHCL